MPAFLSVIYSLLSGVPGMLGEYFKKKQELEGIRLETERQLELAKQKLAAQIAEADYQRAKEMIKATGQWFKYFTFIMWFGPFMIGIISPDISASIFDNLLKMPEWYVQSCILIMFTIWGISASAPVVTNIFSGLQEFFRHRREFKLAKLDRKAYYQAVRDITKSGIDPHYVATQEKIFDRMETGNKK